MENLLRTGLNTNEASPYLHKQKKSKKRGKKKIRRLTRKMTSFLKRKGRKAKKLKLERKIKVLERDAENLFFIIMYGRKHINTLKHEHEALRKKLRNDLFKKDLICIEKNSLARQVKILREQRDKLSSTVRSAVTDAEVMKAERDNTMKLDVTKLRGQRQEATALEQKSNTITAQRDEPSNDNSEERDDLIIEAKGPSLCTVAIEKDKVAVSLKTEHLRGHFEEAAALKEQANTVSTERDELEGERDEVRRPPAYIAAPEDKDTPKPEIEQIREQCTDVETMKEQRGRYQLEAKRETEYAEVRDVLKPEENELRSQRKNASAQKEPLTLETKRQARYSKAIREERDALRLEVEHLRSQCNEVAALKEQRDRLIIEAKRQAKHTKAIKEEREALRLEVEHLRSQCNEVAALKEQRDRLIIEAKRQAKHTKAIKEERDALRLEVERFRSQCNEVAALKEQANHFTSEAKRQGRYTKP
jgi:hypothetical protein